MKTPANCNYLYVHAAFLLTRALYTNSPLHLFFDKKRAKSLLNVLYMRDSLRLIFPRVNGPIVVLCCDF